MVVRLRLADSHRSLARYAWALGILGCESSMEVEGAVTKRCTSLLIACGKERLQVRWSLMA